MTAPAPSRSSSAGRRLPSGQRSPAAITVTGRSGVPSPCPASQRLVAVTFRRDAARRSVWLDGVVAAAAIAEPFGDGSTRRGVNGARRSTAGDRDHGVLRGSGPAIRGQYRPLAPGEGRGGAAVPGVGKDADPGLDGDRDRRAERQHVHDHQACAGRGQALGAGRTPVESHAMGCLREPVAHGGQPASRVRAARWPRQRGRQRSRGNARRSRPGYRRRASKAKQPNSTARTCTTATAGSAKIPASTVSADEASLASPTPNSLPRRIRPSAA